MGDASGYHRTLATGLRALGHEVTVASDAGGWMHTGCDVSLSRPFGGKLGGAALWLKFLALSRKALTGYDVVQLRDVDFISLRPERTARAFDILRELSGSVWLTALSNNTPYIEMCTRAGSPLRYSDWAVGGRPSPQAEDHPERLAAWRGEELRGMCRHIFDGVDGVATALYEYHLATCEAVADGRPVKYCGIPVDIDEIPCKPLQVRAGEPVRILLACHRGREREKGADRLLEVLRRVVARMGPMVEVDFVQNVPYAEFQRRLERAHIVVDQLYSYTPATTALMAMARGKVTVSGAEAEYYDFIGERELRPIVNADPLRLERLEEELCSLIERPERLEQTGRESREFVERHNAAQTVARRFEELWQSKM